MGKFITSFEDHNAYQQAIFDENNTPNVSLCKSEDEIHYNPLIVPPPPIVNGHEYVEIAGIKWATMNIGAESVGDYGNYYQYGKGSAQYAITSGQSDYTGTEDPLAASADTATQVWGSNWRMPTKDEFESLIENTENEYMEIDGVIGYKFTDNSDSSKFIFLPLSGYYSNEELIGFEYYGDYWTSTPFDEVEGEAYHLFIDGGEGGFSYFQTGEFRLGYNIRPVVNE